MDLQTDANHRKNRLLAAVPDEAFLLLKPFLRHAANGQGDVLIEPGALIDRVYFPQSGMISLLIVMHDGETVEASTIGSEGALGLHRGLGSRHSFTRAIVQIPGSFSSIGARDFESVAASSPSLQKIIATYTELLWAEAQQIAACNAIHNASSRLSRWLLQSSDRVQSASLPLTQEFLSQMLGIQRSTVTLLALELQKRGAIEYSRGKITIVDRRILEACACECYEAIQQGKLPEQLGVRLSNPLRG